MTPPSDPWSSERRRLPASVLVLGAVLLAWFFYSVRMVLAPFLFAGILAYLLNPVVSFLEIRGVRRDQAVLLLFIVLLASMTGLVYWGLVAAWQDLPDLRASWPEYMRRAEAAMRKVQEILEFEWPDLKRSQVLERGITDAMAWVEKNVWHSTGVVTSVAAFVANLLLAPFVAFFFLRGGPKATQMALDAMPGVWVERFLSLLSRIDHVFGSYTRAVVLEAFLVGVFSVIGLSLLDLNFASLIGIAAGFGNMVPFFGPILGGAVGVVVAIFQFSNLDGPLRVVLVFLVVHYIDSWILQPLIMKRSVDLNPVTVVFALLAGWVLGGVWGLVFAVPVAGLVKEGAVVVHEWYRSERGLISTSRDIALAAAKPWVI